MSSLTEDESAALAGFAASASLYVGPRDVIAVRELERRGLVTTWRALGGFLAARITEDGADIALSINKPKPKLLAEEKHDE